MTPGHFLWHCVLKQLLWPPRLVLYSLGRAIYAATASGQGPYKDRQRPEAPLRRVQGLFVLLMLATLPVLYFWGEKWSFALAFVGLPGLCALLHGLMPKRVLASSRSRRKCRCAGQKLAGWPI